MTEQVGRVFINTQESERIKTVPSILFIMKIGDLEVVLDAIQQYRRAIWGLFCSRKYLFIHRGSGKRLVTQSLSHLEVNSWRVDDFIDSPLSCLFQKLDMGSSYFYTTLRILSHPNARFVIFAFKTGSFCLHLPNSIYFNGATPLTSGTKSLRTLLFSKMF